MRKIYINLIRYILNLIDFFFQRKIIQIFKKKLGKNLIFFDVGSHHGETVKLFEKKLNIDEFHCFEPSKKNFIILKKKLYKEKYFNKLNLNNFGLGEFQEILNLNFTQETSSSTINELKKDSKYLNKKLSILNIKNVDDYFKKEKINIKTLDSYFIEKNLNKVDILKIDTEGFELNVLKGFKNYIKKTRYIYFEHHFDDMIIKNYKLSDIHNFLLKNNFKKIYKVRMNFRKAFEYIYENNQK